ncbi:MAG: flagellar basal body rod protein FlgB [Desulfobacteraceae bacterium]|jgi:flagellar basal-body rod protein FlgB
MGDHSLFGGNFPLVEKSLSLRSRRHELIVSNIANADTPNYKSFDIVIDQELQKSRPDSGRFRLATTNAKHLEGTGAASDQVTIHTNESNELSLRGDGNTVDIDTQMVNMSENNLLYRASAQIMTKMFGSLRTVISSGK